MVCCKQRTCKMKRIENFSKLVVLSVIVTIFITNFPRGIESESATGQVNKEYFFKDPFSTGNGNIMKMNAILSRRLEILEETIIQLKANVTKLENKLDNASMQKKEETEPKVVAINQSKLNESSFEKLAKKIQGLEASLDMDENYWNYTSQCGGILISQAGQIEYTQPYYSSLSLSYNFPPTCVWTIRANYRSKIQLMLNSIYSVSVTEFFLAEDGTHSIKNTTISKSKGYLFNGPVILVSAPSRTVSLTYTGVGRLIHEDVDFCHFHFKVPTGNFVYQPNATDPSKFKSFSTIVVDNDTSRLIEMDIKLPNSCSNASFNLRIGGEKIEHGKVESCCTFGSPLCNVRRYTLDGWFASSHSSLNTYKDNLKMQWNDISNHSSSISVDKCGGVLMGKVGRISYKKLTSYQNNERCVWVIYPFPKRSIKIKSLTQGFESLYDHLTVHEIDDDNDDKTISSEPRYPYYNKTYHGRVILITFYSDNSVFKQGFDLTWEVEGPSDFNRSLGNERILHSGFKELDRTNLTFNQENGIELFVISNDKMDGSSLDLSILKTEAVNCSNTRLKILGSNAGHMELNNGHSLSLNPCKASGPWNITSPDGIGIIFFEYNNLHTYLQLSPIWNFNQPQTTDSENKNKCGGVVQGTSGRISYKLDMLYENGERCIWLIHSPSSSEIRLSLLKDGFEACCDYLLVNTIDEPRGQIVNTTFVLTQANNTKTIPGNFLIVTFRSDSSVPGKGFILDYTGQGNTNYHFTIKPLHKDSTIGSYQYQRQGIEERGNSGWDYDSDEDLDEQKKSEILVLAYNTEEIESGEGVASVLLNVSVENVVLGMDKNCQSDVLNFYTTPSRDGFILAESYPKLKCHSKMMDNTCGNCIANKLAENDTTPHAFSTIFGAFVAVYKPVRAPVTKNQSFHVQWLSSSGCGGVMFEEEGTIQYKLNSRYKNFEQCIWTVHSPGSLTIDFTLTSNGFETCCDDIILASLDSKTGSIGKPKLLDGATPFVVMDGPVVFVMFRSDSSVTGEGFSLTFSRNASIPSEDDLLFESEDSDSTSNQNHSSSSIPTKYSYRHFHLYRRNSSFTIPQRGPDGLEDIVTITFSPEVSKSEFLRAGNLIKIHDLNLNVNNETCTSDTLKFFEVSAGNLTKSYAVDTSSPNFCTEKHNSSNWNWSCDICLETQTKSEHLMVKVNKSAFLAVYKNVNPGIELEQLKLEWSDLSTQDASSTTTTTRAPRFTGYGSR